MAIPASHTTISTDGQSSSPALAAVDVVAVTTRDDFLLELGQALGGQASVTPVESVADALTHIGGSKKRLHVLAIDSRDLSDLREDIDTLGSQAPEVTTLVFAEYGDEGDVAADLKSSQIFAVLPLPVDVPKTFAVFDGAVADAKAKRAASRPTGTAAHKETIAFEASAPVAAQEPIRPEPRDTGGSSINLKIAGGITLAVIAILGGWLMSRDDGSQPKQPSAAVSSSTTPTVIEKAPAVETSVVSGKVDELLEKARQAMREKRYTDPAGDNALLYYRSAAYADSTSGEAKDGLTRVAAVLASRFEDAISASSLEQASTTFAQFKSAVPGDARLTEFQSKLSKLRAEIQRAEQEEARAKRLAEQQAAREAAAAEQKKAREAKATAAEAERQAQTAREREIQEKARLQQQQAARANEATKTVEKPAAPQRSTSSLQSSLKRKRYVAPVYPDEQLSKGIGGVVTVAYIVNTEGVPSDVHVESASPAGVFDRAAVDAVKRWRYEPLVISGVPTEVPVRLAIRFEPPK